MILPRCLGVPAICAAVLLLPAVSQALDVTLKVDVQPISRTYAGAKLDIAGFRPGMSQADAKALLIRDRGDDLKETQARLSATHGNVSVEAAPYTNTLTVSKPLERLTLYFATPASGSALVGIDHTVKYDDAGSAPLMADVVRRLEEKYGPPSYRHANGQNLMWTFDDRGQIPCRTAPGGCGTVDPSYRPEMMPDYQITAKAGFSVLLSADLIPQSADRQKLLLIGVRMTDNAAKVESGVSALKQLEEAARRGAEARP